MAAGAGRTLRDVTDSPGKLCRVGRRSVAGPESKPKVWRLLSYEAAKRFIELDLIFIGKNTDFFTGYGNHKLCSM